MNQTDIPDPVQDANGIPVVTGDALATNAKLAWLHVRYTQLDPKHAHEPNVPHQANEGVQGHIWYGSLSFILKDFWPALRASGLEEDPAAREASRRINQYLRGTNNMVCLDPGRMDQVSRQRKTHRLPEWWISDEWQVMTWLRPDTATAAPAAYEPEFATQSADVFDTDIPLERAYRDDPDLTSAADPEADGTPQQEMAEDAGDSTAEPLVCRAGCDREFRTVQARNNHESHHRDIDALLDVAAAILHEHGGDPSDISISLISERSGVTRQNVHNHFKTKMGVLRAAARLRGAPLIDVEAAQAPHTAEVGADRPAPEGFTERQWASGRRRLMALAAFANRNGTPLSARMLVQLPWELSTEQREQLVDALAESGDLVNATVRNAHGQNKTVVIAADPVEPDSDTGQSSPSPASAPIAVTDPVDAVRQMLSRYERMELNEQVLVAKVRDAESRAQETETVREELDSLKAAVQAMRSAMLGLPL